MKKSVVFFAFAFLIQLLSLAPVQASNVCKIVDPDVIAKQVKAAKQKNQYFAVYSQALKELHQEASRDARISSHLFLGSVLLPFTSWLSLSLMTGTVISLPQFILAAGEMSSGEGLGAVVYQMALLTGVAQGASHEAHRFASLFSSSELKNNPELTKEIALIYSLDELKKTDEKIDKTLAPWPKDHTQLQDMLSLGRKDVQYLEDALVNINAHQQVGEKRLQILTLLQNSCHG